MSALVQDYSIALHTHRNHATCEYVCMGPLPIGTTYLPMSGPPADGRTELCG